MFMKFLDTDSPPPLLVSRTCSSFHIKAKFFIQRFKNLKEILGKNNCWISHRYQQLVSEPGAFIQRSNNLRVDQLQKLISGEDVYGSKDNGIIKDTHV